MTPSSLHCLRPLFCLALLLSFAVDARAGADPDVDDAIAILNKVDGLTKDEHAKYVAALEKYADLRQKQLLSMGNLLEANEAEVDGKWDSLCDAGLSGLSELTKAVPEGKSQLKDFFATEAAIWEVLKKVEITTAEESETKVRKMVETVTDKAADGEAPKRWQKLAEPAKQLARALNELANPNDLLKEVIDKMLENSQAVVAGLTEIEVWKREEIAQAKAYLQARALAAAIDKAVADANEESFKQWEKAKASMANVQHKKGVAAQSARWLKVTENHYTETRELHNKYVEARFGLVGNIDNDTKARLGDQEFFKERYSTWETDYKAIEEGLNRLEKLINEYRDGDFKNQMKEKLAKCREAAKGGASMLASVKSDYESALSDAGLR